MKKIIAMLLLVVMAVVCLGSCGDNTGATSSTDSVTATGDVGYIQGKGKMVVGITVFEPMNYKENGEWTGFDTEYAQAVAKKLGVEVEFTVIDWDNKWATLNSKKIDVVWNGMTFSEEAKQNASCTKPYVLNAQVVVMKADKLADYTDAKSLSDLKFAVEAGSAGKDIAAENKYDYKEYTAQSDAMSAVMSGKADACIIDITMAKSMTGEGTNFSTLGIGLSLTEEEYAIACRKGSNLADEINKITAELKADGTMAKLAEKYSVTVID